MNEGSKLLGFILSFLFTAVFVWLVALIAGKPKTRRGAAIALLVQIIAIILIVGSIMS